eukprot:15454026-Alexandrium_andersonii.AAC.1
MDINSDRGITLAIALACDLVPGGGAMLGPVCSSWVWVNRGTSQRSPRSPSWKPGPSRNQSCQQNGRQNGPAVDGDICRRLLL